MKKVFIVSLIAISLLIQSCATIFSGTACKVKVNKGNPQGAKVYMNGNYEGDTPCEIKISKNGLKNGQSKITIKADGYNEQEVTLVRKLKVGALLGDILLGLWPLIIDFADGAIYKATPDNIKYDLSKDGNSIPINKPGQQDTQPKQSNSIPANNVVKEDPKPTPPANPPSVKVEFKIGDKVSFKNINDKVIEGKIVSIDNERATVESVNSSNRKIKKKVYLHLLTLTEKNISNEIPPKKEEQRTQSSSNNQLPNENMPSTISEKNKFKVNDRVSFEDSWHNKIKGTIIDLNDDVDIATVQYKKASGNIAKLKIKYSKLKKLP